MITGHISLKAIAAALAVVCVTILSAATPALAATEHKSTSATHSTPRVVEPIDTPLFFVHEGCLLETEFGNYDGVAFGKSAVSVWSSGVKWCSVWDEIVAYRNGLPVVSRSGTVYALSANAGSGWTTPQAQVIGYSVLSEFVTVCSSEGCGTYEYDAL
jgi:hypothetical protein